MSDKYCSRCECTLQRPHPENCNYVRSTEFTEDDARTRHYALIHTAETKQQVQKVADATGRDFNTLAAKMAQPNAQQTIKIREDPEMESRGGMIVQSQGTYELDFSIPLGDFEAKEVDNPSAQERDEVAYVYTAEEDIPTEKTGLVCETCTHDGDEIIWGVDA